MRVVEIRSLEDPRVSVYRNVRDADLRAGEGLFLAEGRRNVKRLLRGASYRPRSVFVTPAGLAGLRDTLERLDDRVPVYLAPQSVLNGIVGYDMHGGCLAAAERGEEVGFERALARHGAERRLWLVLEDVTNPDNVGGIFRNGLAFGVEQALLTPRCADPLYRKSLRVSMGAALRLPFARARAWPSELSALAAAGFHVLALDAAREARPLGDFTLPADARGVALLVGNEGTGLTAGTLAAAHARLTIPMAEGVDSLNAATAAGIALHQLATALSLVGGGGVAPTSRRNPGAGAQAAGAREREAS